MNSDFLPYARQLIDDDDVDAVLNVLRSAWLTTGPSVSQFEQRVCEYLGVPHAVAVSSGTAALHAAMSAIGLGSGDEVIVPSMTFVASVNCVMYQGARPVFSDVDPDTLLISPQSVRNLLTPRTKAVIAVDYAGQTADYDALLEITKSRGLTLIADACHSLGASYKGRKAGTLANLTVFSFHPVKHITTAEGGMVVTQDPGLAIRMRAFRNHGITTEVLDRERLGTWYYEMWDLGFNYRLSDLQCALGISQLKKLDVWIAHRRDIARTYDDALHRIPGFEPLKRASSSEHAFHLYVVRVRAGQYGMTRDDLYRQLRTQNIGTNVHYIPAHLHPYYRNRFSTAPGLCPNAEMAYSEILSLPMSHAMSLSDAKRVAGAIRELAGC